MGKLSSSSAAAIGLAAILISFTILGSNINAIQAQQQDQGFIRQPSTIEIITTAESTTDNFRLQVPQDWIIQDVNNTGAALVSEVLQGFGILAQLCPEQPQETTSLNGVMNLSNSTTASMSESSNSCRDAQEEVIHIVRYPNLGAKLGIDPVDIITNEDITTDTILAYQMQKLQEVGYRDIKIVDSADTGINVDISAGLGGNDTISATVPAKLVEITYSTNLDPYEIKTGYFISTATDATTRNLGMITGYGIFYEGTSTLSASSPLPSSASVPDEEDVLTAISSMLPPEPVSEVFNTFELIAGADIVQAIAQDAVEEQAALVEDEVEGEELASLLTVDVITNGTEGEAPATFVFEADAVGGTEPYTVIWDFDDGSVEENEEQIILHTFDEEGTYNVTVAVIDSEEQIASDSIEITVEETVTETESEEEEAESEETDDIPAVEIISNGIEGEAPATFVFTTEVAGGTEPYTTTWNFGDGSEEVSEDESIVHTFEEPGLYNVSATITDSDGETASDSLEVTVEESSAEDEET
ncbi:MAG: PKD domain-containing protein [Thermoproteota archaeon]|nr:PKD domain-containing protein [Thermoproteota archaeon]